MSLSQRQKRMNLNMDDWFVEIEGIGSGGKEENDDVGVIHEDSDSQDQPVVPMRRLV